MNIPILTVDGIAMFDHIVHIDIEENYTGLVFLDNGRIYKIDMKPWVKNNKDLSYEARFMNAFNRMVLKACMSFPSEFTM